MSALKRLLGLDECPLRDSEIMFRIAEAKKNRIEVLEFPVGTKRVKITLSRVAPVGIMKDYEYRFEN